MVEHGIGMFVLRASVRVTVLASIAACAAGASAAGNYLDEIGAMDAQIAVMRKKIELRNALVELAGGGATVALPMVVSISGFDDDLVALVSYDDGRTAKIRKGDVLPGGVEVKGVRHKGVLVALGKKEAVLDYEPARTGGPMGVVGRAAGPGAQGMAVPMPMPVLPRIDAPHAAGLAPAATALAGQTIAPAAAAAVAGIAPAGAPGVAPNAIVQSVAKP